MSQLITLSNGSILDYIDRAPLAESSKLKYRAALTRALDAGVNFADAGSVGVYARELPSSGRRCLKSALTHWHSAVALEAKAGATPETAAAVQATIYRLEALQEAIQIKAPKGQKFHTWLNQAEVKALLATCGANTPKCFRDKIVLGLLVGAGLRREELTGLTFEAVKQQKIKRGFRVVLDVEGKGSKRRAVPIKPALATDLARWQMTIAAGPGDLIARSIDRAGNVGESLSAVGVFKVVNQAGQAIDKPDLAPHDLRRTFAQLGYEAGVPITQISKLLGHASVKTTQRYLNLDLDLESTVSDFIPYE
ncbi:MAG: site-specific integrase [Anaerolineae bacterium]|nr:site-specific integrase [Anaerolineae bacterium]